MGVWKRTYIKPQPLTDIFAPFAVFLVIRNSVPPKRIRMFRDYAAARDAATRLGQVCRYLYTVQRLEHKPEIPKGE